MTAARPDLPTTAAIAVVAYALANAFHEGLGHGGACLMVGCDPVLLTSMTFHGEEQGLGDLAQRFISSGGTLANLGAAAIALLLLRRTTPGAHARWFFLWLFATINLLQATGYLLFSGLGNIGDWAAVVRGWPMPGLWRLLLAAAGGISYWFAVDAMMKRLGARIPGAGAERLPALNRLTLTAYFTGALLYVTAGLFDPAGLVILFIAAAAASLGGTSGLAWGPQLLRDPKAGPHAPPPLELDRDWRWIAAAAVVAAAFIFVLGPGIALGPPGK